jgi:hypothetical protein
MYGLHLDRALYFAVCKDTDQIHTEWIHFEKPAAEAAIERAQRIALAERMPEPLSTDPSWYQCKMCPFHDFCHVSKMTKQTNCRTCAFSTAKKDSTWRCERHDADDIPVDFQRQGCESHVLHLDLVPWQASPEHCTEHMATFVVDGTLLQNGDPDGNVYSFTHTGPPNLNASGYSNKEVDGWLNEARRVQGIPERRALYTKVAQQLLVDLPRMYVYTPNNLFAMSTRVKGFVPVPDGMIRLQGMSITP